MLKSYKNGLRQVGKRISLSDPLNPTPTQAVVEYMSSMTEGDILKYANACLSYAFPEYHGDAPILRKNDTLKWGARVFVGDDMVDVSFQKIESLLK